MVNVQYLVLNWDAVSKWNRGAVIAQACHASCAAIVRYSHHTDTEQYVSDDNLDSMTKIVLKATSSQFEGLRAQLEASGIDHVNWIERPEMISTCIATRPLNKDVVSSYFKHLDLLK